MSGNDKQNNELPQSKRKRSHRKSFLHERRRSRISASQLLDSASSRIIIPKYEPTAAVLEFYQQIQTNRSYLSKIDNTMNVIYEREQYRNYLNELCFKKILNKVETNKQKVLIELQKQKQHKLQKFTQIIKEIQKLEDLKKGFKEVNEKLREVHTKLQQEYSDDLKHNQQLKTQVKNGWSENKSSAYDKRSRASSNSNKSYLISDTLKVPTQEEIQDEIVSSESNHNLLNEKDNSQIMVTLPLKSAETQPIKETKVSVEQRKGFTKNHHHNRNLLKYINTKWVKNPTKVQIQNMLKYSIKNDVQKFETIERKKKLSQLSNESTKFGSMMNELKLNQYNKEINNIVQIEQYISKCKKRKIDEDNMNTRHWKNKIIKIKERIQKQDHHVIILKLFVTYLKKQQNKNQNYRKIICYFEKIIDDKESILQQVNHMLSSIQI